ncbi:MAG TPA: S53 family peptidase [Steroidobacteraceae bacterium]|nr:S53 family peptidase [Steroidobacteraceae bacterium]
MKRFLMWITACLCAAVGTAALASGGPSLLSRATDLGPVDAATPIEITVWMKLHDQPGLDALVADQQAGKGAYLSMEQLRAQHAPSAADAAKVAAFLKSQGFTVSPPRDTLYVKATASAARVQSTFQVELRQYELFGRTFRASARSATLPPDLVPLVAGVGGLSSFRAEPQIAYAGKRAATNVHTPAEAEGLAPQGMPFNAQSNGLFYSAQCFFGTTTQSFSGGGVSATYTGNLYGAPITNTAFGTLAPCGYQPSDLQTAYNLTPLYQHGLDGTGMTIAIVDAYGSTTIASDVQVFSQAMGLPPANLSIIGTPTGSNFSSDPNVAGWASETTLDVEWVHAVAPGANIILVVSPSDFFSDLFPAIITAASQPGVAAISNSWSGFDAAYYGASAEYEFYHPVDGILQAIGAAGISVNFSTGDYGDNAKELGGLYTSTGWPASSPYATGVGGVSVALDSHKHIAWQTSWGTELTEIADKVSLGSPPIDAANPGPFNEGFDAGGTGGFSDAYPRPFWQLGVPGNRRGTPDISWVADPFTGVEIIYTADAQGDLSFEAIGGTSVACPMFSALWGIATQRAHHPLGQAAPRLYRLPPWSGAITDIVNFSSPNNVSGTIVDAGGTNPMRASELASPLNNQPNFVSALYNSPFSTRWFVITFGVDSTLTTGPGWDVATGLGTPNGWNFVQAVASDQGRQ